MDVRIFPPEEFFEATVELPLSKSMSNRAVVMDAMARRAGSCIDSDASGNVAKCDDTAAVIAAVNGGSDEINVGAAGTAMRFLTAYFAGCEGRRVTLDGTERMRQRPVGALVEALRRCGAVIDYADAEGYPPLVIEGRRLHGGEVTVAADVSSQFISALMMAAPQMERGLVIKLDGDVISRSYILMTLTMMRDRGIDCEMTGNVITVMPGRYTMSDRQVERDWSAASYWYSMAALSSAVISMPGLTADSVQGDRATASYFERLGVLTETDDNGNLCTMPSPEMYSRVELDLSDQPDIAQTIAVACSALNVPFTLTGLSTLRIKETDRLEALRRELDKVGCVAEITRGDGIRWDGFRHPIFEMPRIETYDDHRMAMAFAPLALYIPGLVIRDAGVVTKSYPGFWDDLKSAGFTIEEDKPED